MKKWQKLILLVSVIALVLTIDMITKIVTDGKTWSFLSPFLSIDSEYNYGVAFSFLSGETLLITILTIAMMLGLIVYSYFNLKKSAFSNISLALIIAGGIGNIIDRIAFGYVRDFLKFEFFTFPIFNVADMAVVIGVILFSIYIIFLESKDEKRLKGEKC